MNKQIEETAKFMLEKSNSANATPIFTAEDGTEIVLGENVAKLLDTILEQAFIPFLAECLVKEGYRKSEDVAREIFAEIASIAKIKYWRGGILTEFVVNAEDYAELRKKYESEGKKDA